MTTSTPSRCSWASCHRDATSRVGQWPFCSRHRNEHDAMARRGEIRGQSLALTKDVDPRPNHELTREQLLRAVLAEYGRPVPPPQYELDRAREHAAARIRGRRTKRQVA